ncbi:MAG: tRNA (adenosine(37)-N6)-dimethylallyltransferase MiaA [Psittacicella sp.]
MEKFIICLMGPTASGKTSLANKLYKHLNCELINVDSALIYKDMDIGSAKPSKEELLKTPYHLINIITPKESYSVASFCKNVSLIIEDIFSRGKIPILIGGTIMYFKSLLDGLNDIPTSTKEVREKLINLSVDKGWDYIYNELEKVDPKIAKKLHPNDHQRVGRALEVYFLEGKPMSSYFETPKNKLPYKSFNIALLPDRELIKNNIELRFNEMLKEGLIEEVQNIITKYNLSKNDTSMRSINYKEVFEYLNNEVNLEEMKFKAVCATRQLAKRQYTWLNNWDQKMIRISKPADQLDIQEILNMLKES